jgi:hypothetical protein
MRMRGVIAAIRLHQEPWGWMDPESQSPELFQGSSSGRTHEIRVPSLDSSDWGVRRSRPSRLVMAFISGLPVQMYFVLMQSPILYALPSRRPKEPRR